jgi:hypothetical protein
VGVAELEMGGPTIRVSPGILDPPYSCHDHCAHAEDARFEGAEHGEVLMAMGRRELGQSIQLAWARWL